MGRFALAISLLLSTVSFVRGQAPSAGACGPTSVPNVPTIFVSGCWGLDVSDVDMVIGKSILTRSRVVHMWSPAIWDQVQLAVMTIVVCCYYLMISRGVKRYNRL